MELNEVQEFVLSLADALVARTGLLWLWDQLVKTSMVAGESILIYSRGLGKYGSSLH